MAWTSSQKSLSARVEKQNERSMKKTLTIVGALVLGAALYNASASIVSLGDPFPANSWGQTFNESGVGNFNHLEVFWVGGSLFETPALTSFTDGSWSSGGGNPYFGVANGNTTQSMNFNVMWLGSAINPTVFDFYAWDGSTLKESARATWNGGWSFATIQNPHTAPVPEPTTMIAGALLLLPFGASTIRMLRKNRTA